MGRIKVIAALLAGCLACSFGSVVFATNISVPQYSASYTVRRNGLPIGVADITLDRKPDGGYSYRSKIHPTGLAALFFGDVVIETSNFKLMDGQPRSLRYRYTHSGGHHDKSEEITFDWASHSAESVSDGRKKRLKITDDTYDRALAQLAISLDMAAGKLADTYHVLDHGKINSYKPQLEGKQSLQISIGLYQVIKVARKDARKKRTTTFWLAPKLDYLPVKIEQTEPGKATVSLQLTKIQIKSANGGKSH